MQKLILMAWLVVASPGAALAAGEVRYAVSPAGQVVGEDEFVTATYEDTLTDIGRRYGFGYEEIIQANPGLDPWLPGEGTNVRLPRRNVLPVAPFEGVVVNIAEYRLYFYKRQGRETIVTTFPISIGRMDWATPLGRWQVTSKQKDPTWYPPESIRQEHLDDGRGFLPKAVPPGPDNPLGRHAMRLSASGYLIHGTNKPIGVGMQVTHGCIRMYPEDIEWLFPQVPVATPVTIVNQPFKFGWSGNDLYLEANPPLAGQEITGATGLTQLTEQYVAVTRARPARVDWDLVEEVYDRSDGRPVKVGEAIGSSDTVAASDAVSRLPGG
jgi:L,D-transpeptidase ErfK/SrfK